MPSNPAKHLPGWHKAARGQLLGITNEGVAKFVDGCPGYYWDDLKAPATALKVGSTAPASNTTYGWLEFAHNADAFVFAYFQLPHHWNPGTTLKPHVHWMKTTSATGEVEWQLDYKWVNIGEVLDTSWTTLSDMTPNISDENTAYHHAITGLGSMSGEGHQISDMLICKLTRLGSSYSGSNHYTAAAALLEFDIHYQIDGWGSRQEYIK